MLKLLPTDLIRKKRFGGEHTSAELAFLIENYVSGQIPDYQMSAWLMAVCFQGMSNEETANYTQAIKNSGSCLDLKNFYPHVVDKHSTGGVGDKTSLMLAPIVAEAGLKIPMIAGRGLGHTGGTLDKLESIAGFNVNLSLDELISNVNTHGFSIIGQTKEICPADKMLYALRDVTGTVDSLPLICGSIMSKKLAEGLNALVLDVKFGSGAFMKTEDDAIELATLLKTTGDKNAVDVHALITSMQEPLGRFIGNSLEVYECLEILKGKTHFFCNIDFYADTRELTLRLAGEMIFAGKKAHTAEDGYKMACDILQSGKALKNFESMVQLQGGKLCSEIPKTTDVYPVPALSDGYVQSMDVESVGMASLQLGAGRQKSSDKIDAHVGIEMQTKISCPIKAGEALCFVYSNQQEDRQNITEKIQKAFTIGEKNVSPPTLIKQILR